MPTAAFKHDQAEMSGRRLDVDGQSQPYINNVIWAGPATGVGLPATVAPIGRTESGLLIGRTDCWRRRHPSQTLPLQITAWRGLPVR